MKTLVRIFILSALLITGSCDQTKKVLDAAGEVQLTGTYNVKMVNNSPVTNDITLSFNPLNKQINGDAGCNNYFGDFDVLNFTLTFKGVGATTKMCQPETIMKMEQAYLSALEEVGSYRLNNNTLVLYAKSNNAIIVSADKVE